MHQRLSLQWPDVFTILRWTKQPLSPGHNPVHSRILVKKTCQLPARADVGTIDQHSFLRDSKKSRTASL